MGMGVSILLIAIGAILTWAVSVEAQGVDLQTVGVILMVVGGIGALLSLLFWSSWGGFGSYRRDVYVDRGPTRRRVIEDDLV